MLSETLSLFVMLCFWLFVVAADKYFYCGPITHEQLKNTTYGQRHFVYFIHIYFTFHLFCL